MQTLSMDIETKILNDLDERIHEITRLWSLGSPSYRWLEGTSCGFRTSRFSFWNV